MDKKDLIKDWIDKAENDLLNAENNLNSKQIPTDTVCFHCQQTAEKYLKAYCIYLDIQFEHSDDLFYLLDLINDNIEINDDIYNMCEKLYDYAVKIRYPAERFEPTIDEAKEAFEIAKKIKTYITDKIKL